MSFPNTNNAETTDSQQITRINSSQQVNTSNSSLSTFPFPNTNGSPPSTTDPLQLTPSSYMNYNNGLSATQTVSGTETIVHAETSDNVSSNLTLTLRRPNSVRWDQNVIDNEGLGRKSSKRCCIFHKQREFGESSTDSSDDDASTSSSSSGGGHNRRRNGQGNDRRRIARTKNLQEKKVVPDFQRYHA
eukprot:CAMPEP_0184872746 /NCGR_PEP_ID=MMETSP0580-20130426/41462_1 /TAXON_ID=1118495 /ORGANISM="Dactyliosolen fragilissimus" /LENGTH=187 /DNA_ID=CAMNT_0027375585 /DNA_START=1 /DNA_END=564 /DNA_ORIENTATION=+